MLFQATLLVDLIAMTICLWMAFYLFARGYPSSITLRGAILLLALGAFFFGAYNNLFEQIPGTAAWRSTFLIIGLTQWYHITLHLLPENSSQRSLPVTYAVYIIAIVTIALLLSTHNAFVGEVGNVLYVARMGIGLPYIMFGVFEILVMAGIHYNLLAYEKVGLTPAGRYFLFASIFALSGVVYGIIALALAPPMPRLIQDLSVFCGVFAIGFFVARHQALVERRTTLQEFPITGATTVAIVTAYAITSMRLNLPLQMVGPIAAFVVLTHSLYDLAREFLERSRIQKDNEFRKQLRKIETSKTENTASLQQSLDMLCHALDSSAGFIAIRTGEMFIVTAARSSVEIESRLIESQVSFEDITKKQVELIPNITHFAPSFDGHNQIAVIGIGKPNHKLDYSTGDLELLSEAADQIGTFISLTHTRTQGTPSTQLSINTTEAHLEVDRLMNTLEHNPDPEFTKLVEDGLRNLSDYITLGKSPLVEILGLEAGSHIEQGRELQKVFIESIELLRPAEKRPPEPLPRVWYNHAVLYDAYVEGVPNREIMARLYISEGTFNRTRRNAIRGLARQLMEKAKSRK